MKQMSTDQPKKSKPTVKRGSLVKRPLPERTRDVPATQGMLEGVRSELKSEIRAVRFELTAQMTALDGRLTSQMTALDGKLTAQMTAMIGQLETMNATLFRMAVANEAQRAENRIVLEALTGMMQRQDRVEGRVDVLERFRAPGQ